MNNLDELLQGQDGSRFQRELANFIVAHKLETVVETGTGVSSLFILKAMDVAGFGAIYSVDINPWFALPIVHPRYSLIKQPSESALLPLFERAGEWDLFLHDSNHDIRCMTYELHMAYQCVKIGGYIACDDYTWGGHKAWENFCAAKGLTPFKLGSLEVVQVPERPVEGIYDYHVKILSAAYQIEREWLSLGNKNSDCFA